MIQGKSKIISVIIPVYNAGKVLDKCLDSLAKQTYRALEILFVNDCSTDNTVEVIERFRQLEQVQDLHIELLHHTANKGVAGARNTGLDNATGDYIYYLDADDYIDIDALERMIGKAEEVEADIVISDWKLTYNKNERIVHQPTVSTPLEGFQKLTCGVLRWNLWLFLVRRSLYEQGGFRFMEGMNMGEDMMMMGKLFLSAQRVVSLPIPVYHYVQTNSASLTKDASERHRNQVTANVLELERYVGTLQGKEALLTFVQYLKLSIKLPLLISDNTQNYQLWADWFPESNAYIWENPEQNLRTRLIQWAADKRLYWILKLYYKTVIRFVYGVLYK